MEAEKKSSNMTTPKSIVISPIVLLITNLRDFVSHILLHLINVVLFAKFLPHSTFMKEHLMSQPYGKNH